jgi:hypothetical protein
MLFVRQTKKAGTSGLGPFFKRESGWLVLMCCRGLNVPISVDTVSCVQFSGGSSAHQYGDFSRSITTFTNRRWNPWRDHKKVLPTECAGSDCTVDTDWACDLECRRERWR